MEILKMRETIPPEERNRYLRFYYRHKEKISEKRKDLHTKEEKSAINKENYRKNRERILGYKKKHREKFRAEYAVKAKIKRQNAVEKPTHYLKKYGLDKNGYLLLLEKQKGKCAICRKVEIGKRLAVDHCHKSGKVRGLLCSDCNTSIGKFNDDYKLLQKAVLYLKKHGYSNNKEIVRETA